MKTLILILTMTCLAHSEDWSIAGKDYHNVTVSSVDALFVHITYDGGIGAIKLSDLTPDLQRRFNYDSVAAKQADIAEQNREAQSDAIRMQAQAASKAAVVDVQAVPTKALAPSVDQSSVRAQIAALQADANEKRAIMAREGESITVHHNYSGNGYRDEIADDEARIAQLTAQLTK